MNQIIDERVVEMRFDNKQFEAGAKETMGTLSKLKEALKLPETGKALEGIDKATRNISLDGIASGVDALTNRFSTLGIVGMRIIENITDGLMGKLHAAVNVVTDSIVSGGVKRAMNIENAHFQLQALLKDETKVQAVMADAMESVDGTAYAYDEAAKAASQFAASGIQAGDEMLGALKGITGVAAMTNSSFEDISRIFTTVAGNGRLMGDQLLQLSSRGLNAASTLADYFREVRGQSDMTEASIRELVSKGQISFKDFSDAMTWAFGESAKRANETFTGSLSNMKSALARIGAGFISPLVEQNGELIQLFNALRIKINDVKSALIFDEERSAISGLAEATKMSKDELSEMFKIIKTNGKVSISDLETLGKKGVDTYSTLTKYINGVTDGSIRANYATTTALKELTNGTKVSTEEIRRFVEEGKIDLATFTSAMETEFGKEETLSKQFTDWFLDHISKIVDAINSADMTKPMEVFYNLVDSIKNVVKGLFSILKPFGKAFGDVFLIFNSDDIVDFSKAIKNLTSKMKLSEKGSKNLYKAFKGIFSVVKLLVDVFVKLVSALIPIKDPISEIGDGFLDLAGYIGDVLVRFTQMIRSSELLKRAFNSLSSGFSIVMDALAKTIKNIKNFIIEISKLKGVSKFVDSVKNAFERLEKKVTPYFEFFIYKIKEITETIFNLETTSLEHVLDSISRAFSNLAVVVDNISFDSVQNDIKNLSNLAMSNDGLTIFVKNTKEYGEELRDAFTLDNLLKRIKNFMDIFNKFFVWIKTSFMTKMNEFRNWVDTEFKPFMKDFFETFDLGSAIAAGGSLGIIYSIANVSKSFKNVTKNITPLSSLIGSITKTLTTFQSVLKAEAIIKVAGAIAILSASLVLLSFADTNRLMGAATALTLVAGVLGFGITKIIEALNKGKELNDAMSTFADGLSSTMKSFGKSVQIKAIGSSVKDFAKSIAIIAVSIIALGIMYKKDKEALMAGVEMVGMISLALAGIMVGMSILGSVIKTGMKSFSQAAIGILALSISLGVVVSALNKLFKMDFPSDWQFKVKVLAGILAGLGVLSIAMGAASRLAGGSKVSSLMILAMAVLLKATVSALNKLFKMDFPSDWQEKLTILGLIFNSFGKLMLIMGIASRIAGGSIKAAGTIVAMCAFVVVITNALMVLMLIPAAKLLKGAVALGLILTALGASLYGAGKISSKDTYKNVLSMAITVGAIAASLAILSIIPMSKLLKGAIALGIVLLALAQDFNQISKVVDAKSLIPIIAMTSMIAEITLALYVLTEQPWESLLAGGVALSAVLIMFCKCFELITEAKWSKNHVKKLGIFLMMTTALMPISYALAELGIQPWESLLAGGIALSGVILALGSCFEMITGKRWSENSIKKIGIFLLMTTSLIPITVALSVLAQNPWENLLGAAISLSSVLIAFTGCLSVLTLIGANVGTAVGAALALSSFIGILGGVMLAIGLLFSQNIVPLESILDKGIEILIKIGNGLGSFFGSIVNGFLSQASQSLPVIGENLSKFMSQGKEFFNLISNLDESVFKNIALLSASLVLMTTAELMSGFARLLGFNLADIGTKLSDFMANAKTFFTEIQNVKPESLEGVKKIAEMILVLTVAEIISGIGRWLGIGNNLADFGKQLIEFGPSIAKFASQVKDVKPEAVQGAASAAQIMSELANKLPGTGGLMQKIFGEKSLKDFGKELEKFGPSIVEFSNTVSGVSAEAVQGAANAAEIMAKLANKLPTQGGLAKVIFGERSLADFGKELKKFGPSIVDFANQVSGINPEAVAGCESVTKIMTKLANNLPDSQSLFDKIFGGGKVTLSDFGKEINKFGLSMVLFSQTIAGINVEQINGAIASFKSLVNLASSIQENGTSAEGLTNFVSQLSKIGTDSVSGFVNAFVNSGPKVTTAVINLCTTTSNAFVTGVSQNQSVILSSVSNLCVAIVNKFKISLPTETFKAIGGNTVTWMSQGISSKREIMMSTCYNLCVAIVNKFRTSLPSETFKTIGGNVVIWISQGMNSKKDNLTSTCEKLSNAIINSFKRTLTKSEFKEIGQNAALGLKEGIESKINEIKDAAIAAAAAAIEAAKAELQEASPSKVLWEVGEFFSLGLAGGITDKIKAVSLAATKAADGAIEPVKDTVDMVGNIINSEDFNIDPVIRPIVDLSDVQKGAKNIASLMNRTYDLSSVYDRAIDTASSFNERKSIKSNEENTNSKVKDGDTYEFNQYNYSPKALTRSEIYRQTNNQFSAFRRAVNPT